MKKGTIKMKRTSLIIGVLSFVLAGTSLAQVSGVSIVGVGSGGVGSSVPITFTVTFQDTQADTFYGCYSLAGGQTGGNSINGNIVGSTLSTTQIRTFFTGPSGTALECTSYLLFGFSGII
jgi:hypothetical protein